MSLIEKIPAMSDDALNNLRDNARRLETSGTVRQKADAAELLPALDAALASRRAARLGAAAEKRAAAPKAVRKPKVKLEA